MTQQSDFLVFPLEKLKFKYKNLNTNDNSPIHNPLKLDEYLPHNLECIKYLSLRKYRKNSIREPYCSQGLLQQRPQQVSCRQRTFLHTTLKD